MSILVWYVICCHPGPCPVGRGSTKSQAEKNHQMALAILTPPAAKFGWLLPQSTSPTSSLRSYQISPMQSRQMLSNLGPCCIGASFLLIWSHRSPSIFHRVSRVNCCASHPAHNAAIIGVLYIPCHPPSSNQWFVASSVVWWTEVLKVGKIHLSIWSGSCSAGLKAIKMLLVKHYWINQAYG